jgi:hypothetical protein
LGGQKTEGTSREVPDIDEIPCTREPFTDDGEVTMGEFFDSVRV